MSANKSSAITCGDVGLQGVKLAVPADRFALVSDRLRELIGEPGGPKRLAFMVVLEDRGRAAYAEKLTRKIDDATLGRWLTPEQCVTELGLPDDPL